MKLSGGHIEESQGEEIGSQLMSWFESTKPFFIEKGIFELSSAISTFCLEIKVEIEKRKNQNTRLVWTCLPGMCFDQGTTKGVILTAIMRKTILVY